MLYIYTTVTVSEIYPKVKGHAVHDTMTLTTHTLHSSGEHTKRLGQFLILNLFFLKKRKRLWALYFWRSTQALVLFHMGHQDPMSENNTPTALKACGVNKVVLTLQASVSNLLMHNKHITFHWQEALLMQALYSSK